MHYDGNIQSNTTEFLDSQFLFNAAIERDSYSEGKYFRKNKKTQNCFYIPYKSQGLKYF